MRLFGYLPTGKNYEHRREWICKLLEYQAAVFAVDVGNYSILSNHEHLICRTRPDIAETWTDEDVAWRWKRAWPRWEEEDGQWLREPTDQEVEELLAKPDHLGQIRANLSRLSWFLARWKEPIARLANQESETRGHFWEARFGSRELEGEPEILSCSIYIDLNQVKAGLSPCLAESDHSGIQDRIRAWQERQAQKSVKKFHKRSDTQGDYQLEISQVEQLLADSFLAPIDREGPLMLAKQAVVVVAERPSPALENRTSVENADDEQPQPSVQASAPGDFADVPVEPERSQTGAATSSAKQSAPRSGKQPSRKIHRRLIRKRQRRASDNVILSMPFAQYLEMAEWAAEQITGSGPDPPAHELELLRAARQWDPLHWRSAVADFTGWFQHAAAKTPQFDALLKQLGGKRPRGSTRGRDGFT